jgi:polyribonucleotide nucleotidyltransferase
MNLDAPLGPPGGGGGGRGDRGDRGPKPDRQMPTVGELYEGEVTALKPYGAFIEVLPGTEGLCHVSEMGTGYVKDPADVVSVGQKVKVKVLDVEESGRIRLSIKQADPNYRDQPVATGGREGGGEGGGRHREGGRDRHRPRGRGDRRD